MLIDRLARAAWRRQVTRPERALSPAMRDPALSGVELRALPAARDTRPTGLGMFIGGFGACGSPAQFLRALRTHGVQWVAPLVLWQYRDRDRAWNSDADGADAYVHAARSAGVTVWPWCWPAPGREHRCVATLEARAAAWDAPGVILDPEAAWRRQSHAAAVLMNRALEATRSAGIALAVTSYGAPWWHRTMPWSELARADIGIPQVYDANHSLGAGYPARGVAAWHDLGFQHVVPAFATFRKTAAQLAAHLDSIPPTAAAIGWQWRTTSSREWSLVAAFGHRLSKPKEMS